MMNLTYEDIILDHDGWGPAFKWFILISFSFHIVALWFVMAVLPGLTSPQSISNAESVLIVRPISGTPGTKADGPKPYVPSKESINTTAEPTVPETIQPAPPANIKKPVKPAPAPQQKTDDPEKILQDKIARIRENVKNREDGPGSPVTATPGVPGVEPGFSSDNRASIEIDSRIRDHIIILSNIVRANWQIPSEGMMKGASLDKVAAEYTLFIAQDGTMERMEFISKSGVRVFDISVENAMKKATFPKLNMALNEGFAVKFRFTPQGVNTR